MRVKIHPLAMSALAVALLFAPTSSPAKPGPSHPPLPQDTSLCRRAPSPVQLPPEQAPHRQSRDDDRMGAVPPMAPPPPPSPADEESVAVTGSRAREPGAEAAPAPDARGSAFTRRHGQPGPRAGLLTAGDHDDLLNPRLYANYVDGFLHNERLAGVPRVDTDRVLSLRVEDSAGRPVPFAAVTLTCADGNRLTLATTADGAAVFFPELDRLGERVTASVRYGATSAQATPISLTSERAQRQTIRINRIAQRVQRFDLALVIDTTGSMGDELEYLKTELDAIVAGLRQDHPGLDIRIGLVVYRDEGDDYITHTFPFTSDVAALRGNLAQQHAGGGGDYPEAVEQAMARAVALDWRPDAVRSLLLVADAPPHADDVVSTWRSAEVARAHRIQIVPVGASGVGPGAEYMMRAMAAVTQSRYIFLTDDSGIGNPHAPPSVDCYLVTSLATSIRRVLDSQISGRRVEPSENDVIRTVGHYDAGRCLSQ